MVIWTAHAIRQLRHIHDHIANDSPIYAKRVSDALVRKTLLLEDLPRLGRVVPEFEVESIREIPMYSYRIIYELKTNHIDVLAVIHKRRDLKNENMEQAFP